MSYADIFKKSFLVGFSGELSLKRIVASFIISCMFSVYIFLVYKYYTRNSFYDNSFNISLAAITVIVSSIILTIQSSIVISLGMVGALSIVRFRTAIKSPTDLVFLFWSIANGIICGAGLFGIAAGMSASITALIYILKLIPINRAPLLLLISTSETANRKYIIEVLEKNCSACIIKSQAIENGYLDMIFEIRVKDVDELLSSVSELESITRFSLINHDGETTF